MSQVVIEAFLQGEKVIVPFEDLQGTKQVASIISYLDSHYTSFSLVDDDFNFGPADLINSGLSSKQVHD